MHSIHKYVEYIGTQPFFEGLTIEVFGIGIEIFLTVCVIGIITNLYRYLKFRGEISMYSRHILCHLEKIAVVLITYLNLKEDFLSNKDYQKLPRHPPDFFEFNLPIKNKLYKPFKEVGYQLAYLRHYFCPDNYDKKTLMPNANKLVKN
jgi:hypothetical protein